MKKLIAAFLVFVGCALCLPLIVLAGVTLFALLAIAGPYVAAVMLAAIGRQIVIDASETLRQ